MTELMDKAIRVVAGLSEDRQDQLAELLIGLADPTPYQLSESENQAVEHGRADIKAGRIADDAEVVANFTRLRSA